MPLSDLTGTKWVLNESINFDTRLAYAIDFTSNNTIFGSILIGRDPSSYDATQKLSYYSDSYLTCYNNGSWTSQAYRIISITGGSDATNATLISWLQNNATQVEVTDLSGTSWNMNSSISTSLGGTYSFLSSMSFTSSGGDVSLSGNGCFSETNSKFVFDDDATDYSLYYSTTYNRWEYWGVAVTNVVLSITSGTDTTNPDLIAWLSQNATYQAPVVGNVYELTHSLTNLTHGNVSFTITPDAGYSLPSSVTVTNGTLVSYDSSTGVVVVNGDDTTIVSVECVEESISVKIAYQNNQGAGPNRYKVNDGVETNITYRIGNGSSTSLALAQLQAIPTEITDINKLEVYGTASLTVEVRIYNSNGVLTHNLNEYQAYSQWCNITEYIENGGFVVIYGDD